MILLIIFGVLSLFQIYQAWETHRMVKTLHEMEIQEQARYMPPPEIVFGFNPPVDMEMTERNPAPE